MYIPRLPSGTAEEFRLSLLGAFELTVDAIPVVLQGSSQRLVAFLGVRDRTVPRSVVAGTLWPDASEAHARASLRTLLSRLDDATRNALRVNVLDLRLAEGVELDLRDSRALAHRLLIVDVDSGDSDLSQAAIAALSSDLLPDWYDDWAADEAAKWHELRLRALEALAEKLASVGRFGSAAEAASLVITAEPFRESGHAALIRVQQAQGDYTAARSTFDRFRAALRAEMDIEPTAELKAMVTSPMPKAQRSSVIREAQTAAAGEETRAFEVAALGISMEPSIRHGDKLMVSEDVELQAGRIVVAVHNDFWIVKRLAIRDGQLVLRSDNADEEVAIRDVEIKGVVVELRRTL